MLQLQLSYLLSFFVQIIKIFQFENSVKEMSNDKVTTTTDSSTTKKQFDFADILQNMNHILKPVGAEVQMKRKNEKTGDAEDCDQEEAVKITNFRIQAAAAQHAMKEMSYLERKEWLVEKKDEGNVYFKEKDYEKACEMYMQAISALTTGETEEEKADAVTHIQVPLVNNLAACYAEMGNFSKVAALSNEVLRLDPNNLKATLRMGHALLNLREHKEAKIKLERAIELSKSADLHESGGKVARKAKKLLHHLTQSVNRNRQTAKKMMDNGLGAMYEDKDDKDDKNDKDDKDGTSGTNDKKKKKKLQGSGRPIGISTGNSEIRGEAGTAQGTRLEDDSDASSVDTEDDEDGYSEGTLVGHFGSTGPTSSSLKEFGDALWNVLVDRCCHCFREKTRGEKKKEELSRFLKKNS